MRCCLGLWGEIFFKVLENGFLSLKWFPFCIFLKSIRIHHIIYPLTVAFLNEFMRRACLYTLRLLNTLSILHYSRLTRVEKKNY